MNNQVIKVTDNDPVTRRELIKTGYMGFRKGCPRCEKSQRLNSTYLLETPAKSLVLEDSENLVNRDNQQGIWN